MRGRRGTYVGNPWTDDITHVLWFGISTTGITTWRSRASSRGRDLFTRSETFSRWEPTRGWRASAFPLPPGNRKGEGRRLRTTFSQRPFRVRLPGPVLIYGQGFNFLGEFLPSQHRDQTRWDHPGATGATPWWSLFTREWSVAARSTGRSVRVRRISPAGIISGRKTSWSSSQGKGGSGPSRPIPDISRQPLPRVPGPGYKHTDRDFDDDTDELLLQGLFIVGFERPDPF